MPDFFCAFNHSALPTFSTDPGINHPVYIFRGLLYKKPITMKKILLLLCIFFAVAATIYSSANRSSATLMTENEMPDIQSWPEASRIAANDMISKYGKPNEVTSHKLIWHNNGPWKRTVIYDKETKHSFPVEHTDVMEQTIDYKVAASSLDELAEYDGSVTARRTDGELSAKCDKEGANFLAINLANDIITGKKTVAEARSFYATAIKEFALMNKMSPYMQSFQFSVAKGGTGDADKHAVSASEHEQITARMMEMNKQMKDDLKESDVK
jgi:hypothetical protein